MNGAAEFGGEIPYQYVHEPLTAPEDLAHRSPARYDRVNPYGRYQFRVDRWADKRPVQPIKV